MDDFSKEEKLNSIDDVVNSEFEDSTGENKPSKIRTFTADSIPQTVIGTIFGTLPDYLTGLNPIGILITRATALLTNYALGGFYGKWRKNIFDYTKTNQDSNFFRKYGAEMLSYETFQVPTYSVCVALGSLISDNEFDYKKVMTASLILFAASPITSLVLGWGMDKSRKALDVEPVAWKGYKKK